ncbi:hypothetical protein [Rossellomorea aquimaris]|uniref:hypothetical protein n=1 Tax=Rossellomorea aquimaris TaxID=189382 RepID=UPI001653ED53|nr:hypothetical protein [Rossellomorea aquimaris]
MFNRALIEGNPAVFEENPAKISEKSAVYTKKTSRLTYLSNIEVHTHTKYRLL